MAARFLPVASNAGGYRLDNARRNPRGNASAWRQKLS